MGSNPHPTAPGDFGATGKAAPKAERGTGIFPREAGFSRDAPGSFGPGADLGGDEDGLGARGRVGAVVGVLHQLHRPQQRLRHHGPQARRGALRQQQRLPARLDSGVPAWKTAHSRGETGKTGE